MHRIVPLRACALSLLAVAIAVGLAACGSSASSSSTTVPGTTAAAAALTQYEQFAVARFNDPATGFVAGLTDLTGSAPPAVPADAHCMVFADPADETQAQVDVWTGTGADLSVVIVMTNGLEPMNSSTSSYGPLFGPVGGTAEGFTPPTDGTPCAVGSDWTITV